MLNILREVRALREEGKLHKRLIFRVRMLLVISAILTAISIYHVVARDVSGLLILALILASFCAGLFLFSRMNPVQWNEESEIVESGAMDVIGYATLALYIVFEIGLRTAFTNLDATHATTFILACVGGSLLGRSIGTLVTIHRVYTATHSAA